MPRAEEPNVVGRLDGGAAPVGFVPAGTTNMDFVLQPAVAIYLRRPGETRYRPLTLELLRVVEGQVVEVVDWSRPELFEAFGLPMSFPPPRRSNLYEDEFNAKEVR